MNGKNIENIINGNFEKLESRLDRIDKRLTSHCDRLRRLEILTAEMTGSWRTWKWSFGLFLSVIIMLLIALILRTI